MLKWQGDFTLPRLRAKLASKNLLHPNVEPEYAEVYRPDLSQAIVCRKGSLGILQGETGRRSNTWNQQLLSASASMPNSHQMDIETRGSFNAREMPFSMRKPLRSNSVPTLGMRRALVAPASLQPLPPGFENLANVKGFTRGPSFAAATEVEEEPSDDPRIIEKERQAELASKRFWIAANGNDYYLQEALHQILQEDPKPNNAQILARLKATQTSAQMNKARKEGARIDWRNAEWDGATLLIKAVRTGSHALAMHLLAIGADPNVVDFAGRGMLHWVVNEGNAFLASYIFDNLPETSIDGVDDGGDTPLHLAAYHGHLVIARLLIRNGADCWKENAGGFTPQALAEARRKWHVVTYMNEYKLLQEDQETELKAKIRDLLRPCDMDKTSEANRIRAG